MPLPQIVYGLSGVWLLLFIASFFVTQQPAEGATEFARGLNRLASLLTWQAVAFGVAVISAWNTREGVKLGHRRIKLAGYLPLGASVFLLVTFIAIIAYRFFVAPLLP